MQSSRNAVLIGLAMLSALTACDTTPERNQFPKITFKHLPPIELEASRLEVDLTYEPPLQAPNVEHEFPLQPATAAAQWARDRLKPVGFARTARFTVKEASVVETELQTSGGLKGMFTVEQARQYDAQLAAELEIIGEDGRVERSVSARARRSVTVPEDITLNELERAWFALVEKLMRDFDAGMERQLGSVLSGSADSCFTMYRDRAAVQSPDIDRVSLPLPRSDHRGIARPRCILSYLS